jgi:hypothetical protein
VKYDTLGNLVWQKTINTHDRALTSTLLADHHGNLYVAGWERDAQHRPTVFVGKYDETGKTSWFTKYFSEEIDFELLRFDIMEPENFVAAGILQNTGELFYIKYSSSGQFLGSVAHKTEKSLSDFSDLKLDPAGNIYLSATIADPDNGDDFLLIAYNDEDSLLWVNEYDGEAHNNDVSQAIAIDETLNIYVTGSSEDANGIPAVLTVKYDRSGNHIWSARLDRKDAARPLIFKPRYLSLGRRPYQEYFYIAGTTGNSALIARLNVSGVYSFQAEYGERGKMTIPTALSTRCLAFERTKDKAGDAYVTTIGPSAILGIARWD